jgi:hypothetical protein
MLETPQVANPGSLLARAVNVLIKQETNRLLRPIVENYGCVYATVGKLDPRTGYAAKLLLQDNIGNSFQVDAVIATHRLQPLILIQSSYAHHKKRERGKNLGICTAHFSLRRTYPTLRQSLAILAGSWDEHSKAIMRSFDHTVFEIGSPKILSTLAEYGIAFDWGKKAQDCATEEWMKWEHLSNEDYDAIAHVLLKDVAPRLRETLCETLDTSVLAWAP